MIDTADPAVSEELICRALWPYDGIVVATKAGQSRQGPDRWAALGRPEYLRQSVLMSLRRLKLEQLSFWQLHRIDRKAPRDDQFGALAEMRKEGLIGHIGLCAVDVEDIEAAQAHFPVAAVQNEFNLVNRRSEALIDYCASRGIGFIPWYPLAEGNLARPSAVLAGIATEVGATPSQVAIAWLLKRSPNVLLIPGTSKLQHLRENVAAGALTLSDEQFRAIDQQARQSFETQPAQ